MRIALPSNDAHTGERAYQPQECATPAALWPHGHLGHAAENFGHRRGSPRSHAHEVSARDPVLRVRSSNERGYSFTLHDKLVGHSTRPSTLLLMVEFSLDDVPANDRAASTIRSQPANPRNNAIRASQTNIRRSIRSECSRLRSPRRIGIRHVMLLRSFRLMSSERYASSRCT